MRTSIILYKSIVGYQYRSIGIRIRAPLLLTGKSENNNAKHLVDSKVLSTTMFLLYFTHSS
jgi:hypothetical protein